MKTRRDRRARRVFSGRACVATGNQPAASFV